jgi:hypothetical protein
MRDLSHDYKSNMTVKPATLTTANANGTGVDLLGYSGALMVAHLGAVGALQDGTNKCIIHFVESTDNSTFTAIADTDLVGGNNTQTIDANAEANTSHQRSYVGAARYVAIQFEVAGTISLPVVGEVIRGKPHYV